jgi:MFS family permease
MEIIQDGSAKTVWRDGRVVALLMAASLTTMANATISPALPGLHRLFADDPNAVLLTRLLVPAPSLSVALVAPIAGLLVDRFGRRPLLLGGVVLFALAGCAGLVLPSLSGIFASRLALGIAVAFIMTAQTTLVGDYFTGEQRSILMGWQTSARNFGGFLFISLAGLIAQWSPRWPFAIYGLALFFLPLMWTAIIEPNRTRAAQIRPSADDLEETTWFRPFAGLVALQAATNMLFFLVPTQLPFLFDARGYESAAMSGSALGVLTLVGGGISLLYARLQRRIGYARLFAFGYAAMAVGFFLLTFPAATTLSFVGAGLIGAGYASVSPTFVAITLRLAPTRRRGLAGGILTASVFLGQFISPLLSTPVILLGGYDGLFEGAAALLAAMALIAVTIRPARTA